MIVNMTDQYTTMGGRPVRVLAVDVAHSTYPVIALIDGCPETYTAAGCYYTMNEHPSNMDLKLVTPLTILYVNIYPERDGSYRVGRPYASASLAMDAAANGSLGLKAIDITELVK